MSRTGVRAQRSRGTRNDCSQPLGFFRSRRKCPGGACSDRCPTLKALTAVESDASPTQQRTPCGPRLSKAATRIFNDDCRLSALMQPLCSFVSFLLSVCRWLPTVMRRFPGAAAPESLGHESPWPAVFRQARGPWVGAESYPMPLFIRVGESVGSLSSAPFGCQNNRFFFFL